jgi:hypothetical protein
MLAVHCNITEVETTNWSITIRDIAECSFLHLKKSVLKQPPWGPFSGNRLFGPVPLSRVGGGGVGGGTARQPKAYRPKHSFFTVGFHTLFFPVHQFYILYLFDIAKVLALKTKKAVNVISERRSPRREPHRRRRVRRRRARPRRRRRRARRPHEKQPGRSG